MPVVQFYNINYSVTTKPISLIPLIGAFLALLCFYIVRGIQLNKNYKSALKNLKPIFGEDNQAVLFRCNDQEIDKFAKTKPEGISTILKSRSKETRWQIIFKRFALNQDIFDV
jgi:lauroyl/myristoyl acyltransferase